MLKKEQIQQELKRKIIQLNVSLREDVEYKGPNYFQDIVFIQNNISSVRPEEVDLTTEFLGQKLDYPIMISPMVGGFKDAKRINEHFAEAAKENNIAMGVGNQVYGLMEEPLAETYQIARETSPDSCIFANFWAKYIPHMDNYLDKIKSSIEMVDADILHLVLSPLTELFYSKNESRGGQITQHLEEIIEAVDIPVVVRSLESGLCHEDVRQLWDLGVSGIDSQGMGGTDLVKIESLKHMSLAEKQSKYKPKVFDYWGLHTIWSLLDIKLRKENQNIPLIVGGGIRNGLLAAKCLALGADIVCVGYPFLLQVIEDIGYPDEKNLQTYLTRFLYEIKMVMASIGARNVDELREICRSRLYIKGETKGW